MSAPDEAAAVAAAEPEAPLSMEERFELFTYEVESKLGQMLGMLEHLTIMVVTIGRVMRITKPEIEEVEANLYGSKPQPTTAEASAAATEATPPVETGSKGE